MHSFAPDFLSGSGPVTRFEQVPENLILVCIKLLQLKIKTKL